MKPFNEYTLFLILEQERNSKLKEIYRKKGTITTRQEENVRKVREDTGLPMYPPRYQSLGFSAEWFVSRLNNKIRPLPTKTSAQRWDTLDRISKEFIHDVAAVLRDRNNNRTSQRVSPLTTDEIAFHTSKIQTALSQKNQFEKSTYQEVDMCDIEVRALWESINQNSSRCLH